MYDLNEVSLPECFTDSTTELICFSLSHTCLSYVHFINFSSSKL